MFSLVDMPKLLAALALGISVAGPVAYFQGKAHQRQAMAVEALESSVKILREKGEIDAQVSSADAADLCGSYGLPIDEERECVRRLQAAAAEARDDGLHPPERQTICERRGGP
ncbi:hypothetical protein GOL97_19180 [Sinorhizobium medicae]|nr:hypothetical protein [Sinorhizobium medicae]MDX0530686.1 hypothetical protein [Sinorhizobium medicae]MDX1205447.1 hypothetical protein [Sinorhizobium medicae]